MAGETVKAEAICLDIRPWSKTSHVVSWLTPHGKVATVVKGAVRPKSFFLGQYDLNYTCDILYYARARGELHALRDCAPLVRRDELRDDYRRLAMAGYFRSLVAEFAPTGPDAEVWYRLLSHTLDALLMEKEPGSVPQKPGSVPQKPGSVPNDSSARVVALVAFELKILHLLGLDPALEAESGVFALRGERTIPVSREVALFLRDPTRPVENGQIPLDAARVIGVFYQFHLEWSSDVRRTVLGMIC